ncbi:MAG: single-stranded DNA-binding protein [Dehalococcoidia bacterium]|jgi:single-strand DNA-binding protein
MASLNKVMIIGNLGADPEMRFTPSGSPVTSFRIASSRTFTTPEGEKKQETEWFTVVAWSKLAELCNQFLSKGRMAYVEGRLKTRSWDDKEGVKHYKTEVIASQVIFLDRSGAAPLPEEAAEGGEEVPPEELPF